MKYKKHIQKIRFLPLLMIIWTTAIGNTNCHKDLIIQPQGLEETTIIITDKVTGKGIPFAYCTIGINDSMTVQLMADSLGKTVFKINTGKEWQIHLSSIGYKALKMVKVRLLPNVVTSIQLEQVSIQLDTFTIIESKVNLIECSRCGCGCRWVTTHQDSVPEVTESNIPSIQIMAYPNPTKSSVTLTNLQMVAELHLFDLNGRNLQTIQVNNTNERLDLSQYPVGVYIIQYLEKGKVNALKIVKE